MKFICMMNGWRDCPSCWWRYLLFPFRLDGTPKHIPNGWWSISAFGFVFFFERGN